MYGNLKHAPGVPMITTGTDYRHFTHPSPNFYRDLVFNHNHPSFGMKQRVWNAKATLDRQWLAYLLPKFHVGHYPTL